MKTSHNANLQKAKIKAQHLLELANAEDSKALHGGTFTASRVADLAREIVESLKNVN